MYIILKKTFLQNSIHNIRGEANKYQLMTEDSTLEKDRFIDVEFNFNGTNKIDLLVGDLNIAILSCVYLIEECDDFVNVQKQINLFVNEIILTIRRDLGLITEDGKIFRKKYSNRTRKNRYKIKKQGWNIFDKWKFYTIGNYSFSYSKFGYAVR